MRSHSLMSVQDIAARLGLKRHPRSGRGRCPACDYAGIFSIRAGHKGRALLFCASCRDRDALVQAVALVSGQDCPSNPRSDRDEAARHHRSEHRSLALCSGSELLPSTPAEIDLVGRGFNALAASPPLRFRSDTSLSAGGRYLALIALSKDHRCPIAVAATERFRRLAPTGSRCSDR
jgi:hypothetical protein